MVLGFCDGTDGKTKEAVEVAVRDVVAIVEVEVVRITDIGDRTRPVVAVRAVIVEIAPVAVARSREDANDSTCFRLRHWHLNQ